MDTAGRFIPYKKSVKGPQWLSDAMIEIAKRRRAVKDINKYIGKPTVMIYEEKMTKYGDTRFPPVDRQTVDRWIDVCMYISKDCWRLFNMLQFEVCFSLSLSRIVFQISFPPLSLG